MPYINIWIHLIWATKNRHPFLNKKLKNELIKHIRENAIDKGIHLDSLNGYHEHLHALISLKADQSVSKVAQLLKGESSHWVNVNCLTKEEFGWQDEYLAFSVSHASLDKVRQYIKNQEEHHRTKLFAQEYELFLKKYGFRLLGNSGV